VTYIHIQLQLFHVQVVNPGLAVCPTLIYSPTCSCFYRLDALPVTQSTVKEIQGTDTTSENCTLAQCCLDPPISVVK